MKQIEKQTLCDCGHIVVPNGFSTGYGVDSDGKKICFACCGEQDKQTLRKTEKLTGYYSNNKFSNWPGSFSLNETYSKTSNHNWAGKNSRVDYWVEFEGSYYHGVQIGNNSEVSTIRKIKD